jgi:ribonuclease HIII
MNKQDYYDKISKALTSHDFWISPYTEIAYGLQFTAKQGNRSGLIRIYESKKGTKVDLSQVKDASLLEIINQVLGTNSQVLPAGKPRLSQVSTMENFTQLIGIDESGKGDYFGPLVVAACLVHKDQESQLQKLGVGDCKKIADAKIKEIAPVLRQLCPFFELCLMPIKYNQEYAVLENLNHLLAQGHAQVLEKVLAKTDCKTALSDQFANPNLIKSYLQAKGQNITLHQRPKAEANLAVAAASVLARDRFINELADLSEKFVFEFPKGAGEQAQKAIEEFIRIYGKNRLNQVAKLHFKLTPG